MRNGDVCITCSIYSVPEIDAIFITDKDSVSGHNLIYFILLWQIIALLKIAFWAGQNKVIQLVIFNKGLWDKMIYMNRLF